jgi:hypothetical protein
MRTRRILVVATTAVVLSLGSGPLAQADKPDVQPCAKQEQQVTKAEAALARVTAVFEHQQTKVERLQAALAAATTPAEQAKLQAKLTKALAHKQHVKKDKVAQVRRLEKATERLAACQAAQEG